MELKNALSVCLIALVSATLVVLVARVLDNQAAARLEPQLARIVQELEGIRKAGGIVPTVETSDGDAVDEGLVAYYFHSNTRCTTCRTIEEQAHRTLVAEFSPELASRQIVWKKLNYEESGAGLAEQFGVHMPVVVLARMRGGQLDSWKRLDAVWGHVRSESRMAEYLGAEIRQMLAAPDAEPDTLAGTPDEPEDVDLGDLPVPE